MIPGHGDGQVKGRHAQTEVLTPNNSFEDALLHLERIFHCFSVKLVNVDKVYQIGL